MNDFKFHADQLKTGIDSLTNEVIARIQEHSFQNIDALLTHRHSLVAELIALHANEAKEDLIQYLLFVRERDKSMMQALKEKQELVKSSLLRIGKIKQYVE